LGSFGVEPPEVNIGVSRAQCVDGDVVFFISDGVEKFFLTAC
jgi:hypothetical protein